MSKYDIILVEAYDEEVFTPRFMKKKGNNTSPSPDINDVFIATLNQQHEEKVGKCQLSRRTGSKRLTDEVVFQFYALDFAPTGFRREKACV